MISLISRTSLFPKTACKHLARPTLYSTAVAASAPFADMAGGKTKRKQSFDDNILGKRKVQPEVTIEEPVEEELAVPVQKKRRGGGKKGMAEALDVVQGSESEEAKQEVVQPSFRSKEKILLLTSRGISPRWRFLQFIPLHAPKPYLPTAQSLKK